MDLLKNYTLAMKCFDKLVNQYDAKVIMFGGRAVTPELEGKIEITGYVSTEDYLNTIY